MKFFTMKKDFIKGIAALVGNSIVQDAGDAAISPLDHTTVEQTILFDVRMFEMMK